MHFCPETDYATYSRQPTASQICETLPPTTEVYPSSLIIFGGIQHTTRTKKILIIKPTRCTNFSMYFWKKLYMFETVPLSIIRSLSLYTQQWYMSYRFADSLRAGSGHPDPACKLYDIYHCCVYSEKLLMMDTGTV